MPVAVFQHVAHLEQAGGEQTKQDHHREADVEPPEAAADILFKPSPEGVVNCLAQHENHECDTQHAEDTHHRRMTVIGGKIGPRLEIADDWHVDQKAEYAGSRKVPKANSHQEIESPFMPKRRPGLAARY